MKKSHCNLLQETDISKHVHCWVFFCSVHIKEDCVTTNVSFVRIPPHDLSCSQFLNCSYLKILAQPITHCSSRNRSLVTNIACNKMRQTRLEEHLEIFWTNISWGRISGRTFRFVWNCSAADCVGGSLQEEEQWGFHLNCSTTSVEVLHK